MENFDRETIDKLSNLSCQNLCSTVYTWEMFCLITPCYYILFAFHIGIVSPSLHANTSLSITTSPGSSATSSPSSSLDMKLPKSSPAVQDNKAVQKQKSVDSKKIICDAIERIFCVDIQVSFCYKFPSIIIIYIILNNQPC